MRSHHSSESESPPAGAGGFPIGCKLRLVPFGQPLHLQAEPGVFCGKIKITLGVVVIVAIGASVAITKLCQNDRCYIFPWQKRAPKITETIGNELEKQDLIRITNPRPNATIESPLTVEGEVRGSWYFEASFPVVLIDANSTQIASGAAQAQGDWMTHNFVPFRATLVFNPPTTEHGMLVLKKDNPSGLPGNQDELHIPVVFKKYAR